jgi:hypothetical protein
LSGISARNFNGLWLRDAPAATGPHKTFQNRCKRWSDKGNFAGMMAGPAAEHGEKNAVMVDAIYLNAHRMTTRLGVKKAAWTSDWPNRGQHQRRAARHLRQSGASSRPLLPVRASQRLPRRATLVGPIAKNGTASRRQ